MLVQMNKLYVNSQYVSFYFQIPSLKYAIKAAYSLSIKQKNKVCMIF